MSLFLRCRPCRGKGTCYSTFLVQTVWISSPTSPHRHGVSTNKERLIHLFSQSKEFSQKLSALHFCPDAPRGGILSCVHQVSREALCFALRRKEPLPFLGGTEPPLFLNFIYSSSSSGVFLRKALLSFKRRSFLSIVSFSLHFHFLLYIYYTIFF